MQLITVEQFRQLPEEEFRDEFIYELQYGEIVTVPRPKHGVYEIRFRLFRLLDARLSSFGQVAFQLPYRPFREFELRVADVAAISRERWEAVDPDDDLYGTPELVIEVKWPFNTERQLRELVSICLNKNTAEFWVVDPKQKSVTVVRRDGTPVVFEAGAILSLAAFGGGELPVDEIFA